MYGLLFLLAIGAYTVLREQTITEQASDLPQRLSDKLDKLWDIAHESIKERKYLRAEKALLTILRVDERNASAYNRLGILYAKQQAYRDAIECFEIAQSLEPSASSLHNVGLIYFETEAYDKAAIAFEQALGLENDHASRHIAYAKVQEKLGHIDRMFSALETGAQMEPSIQTFNILADAYERHGRHADAEATRERLKYAANKHNTPQRVAQKRKVVM